jgi:hypothetical protein
MMSSAPLTLWKSSLLLSSEGILNPPWINLWPHDKYYVGSRASQVPQAFNHTLRGVWVYNFSFLKFGIKFYRYCYRVAIKYLKLLKIFSGVCSLRYEDSLLLPLYLKIEKILHHSKVCHLELELYCFLELVMSLLLLSMKIISSTYSVMIKSSYFLVIT